MRAKAQAPVPQPDSLPIAGPTKGSGYAKAFPIVLVIVLLIGGLGYFVQASINGKAVSDLSDVQVRDGVDPKEVANVIDRVRELVAVKEDELPTVATIQDISVLQPQNPTLYRDAENGDKLLVWSDKVVVYSTAKNRVLVAMPINISAETAPQSSGNSTVAAATVTPTAAPEDATIEVRNGTPTAGLARTLNDKLKAAGFKTVAPGDAKTKNYTKTMILNASGKSLPDTLAALVKETGGTVVDALPEEGKSPADILVIVGQ